MSIASPPLSNVILYKSNSSLLQPAAFLPSQKTLDTAEGTQQATGKSVMGLEGKEGQRRIGLSTPVSIAGTVNGADNVQSLAELKPDAVTPQQIGARRDQTISLVNKLINAIEDDRKENGGELSAKGKALRGCLDCFSDTVSLLGDGPVAGDKLMLQMQSLEDQSNVLDRIELEIASVSGGLSNALLTEVDTLQANLRAQLQDRTSYLAHTVADSPLSLHRMYESKAQFSEGAVRVINQQLTNTQLSDQQRSKLEDARNHIFQARAGQLHQEARDHFGQLGNPKEVLGKKPSGFLSKLPISAQYQARKSFVQDLLTHTPGGSLPSCNTPKIDEQTLIQDTLKEVFKAAKLDTEGLKHAFHDAMNDALNNGQDWKPVLKEMQLRSDSETLLSYSEITPAGNFIDAYAGKGFNAHSTTEYTHAVNLAQTQLRDGQGEVLFSGLRHGVISAYGIQADEVRHMSDHELTPMVQTLLPQEKWARESDGAPSLAKTLNAVRADSRLVDTMRHAANDNRAREIVLATVLTDKALMQRALAGETVPLDILSISLLTPDNLRPILQGVSSNERQMLQEQMQAWDNAKGLKTFAVADAEGHMQQISVDVRPVACNYGVNAGAVGTFSWAAGGWDNVAGINAKAIEQLLGTDTGPLAKGTPGGLIGERMLRLEQQVHGEQAKMQALGVNYMPSDQARRDDTHLTQARELVQQIARIHQEGSSRSAGQEPYKMPTRLAVLAESFGIKVMFNCKSGKDRTGELDAEIKHLKLQMGLTGKVPHYERARSAAEITQFHEVLTHSGNFEMQRLNTGYAGYKLKGVDALYQQFGGLKKSDAITANFLGLSSFTSS